MKGEVVTMWAAFACLPTGRQRFEFSAKIDFIVYPSKELSLIHGRGGDETNRVKYSRFRRQPASGCLGKCWQFGQIDDY